MKLSRTVTYGLRAAIQLAEYESQAPVPCSRIASDGKMPERFLLQILRTMVTHGVLDSTRGVDGGYSLVRSAHEITFLEIIEAIDGPLAFTVPNSQELPAGALRILESKLGRMVESNRTTLSEITLASLKS